jgi:proline iminopeptidase
MLNSPDEATRMRAVREWAAWEDAVIAHESQGHPGAYSNRPDDALVAMVRIIVHYFANNAWLEDNQLLRNAHRLAGIPGVIVQGRLDLGCPLKTAWDLAQAWPDADLKICDDGGHTGSPTMTEAVLEAHARFAKNGH